MKYIMEDTLINKVLQYLSTKPYLEVATLIKEVHEGCSPAESSPMTVEEVAEEK